MARSYESRQALAALIRIGIPQREAWTSRRRGVSYAFPRTAEGRALIDAHADRLAAEGLGVQITKYPCGCVLAANVHTHHLLRGVSRDVTQAGPHSGPCYRLPTGGPSERTTRRGLLRELTQEAVEGGSYGEPAPVTEGTFDGSAPRNSEGEHRA